jgi:hypothetical protein
MRAICELASVNAGHVGIVLRHHPERGDAAKPEDGGSDERHEIEARHHKTHGDDERDQNWFTLAPQYQWRPIESAIEGCPPQGHGSPHQCGSREQGCHERGRPENQRGNEHNIHDAACEL